MDPVPEIFIILIDRVKVNVDNAPSIMENVSGIKMTLKEQNVAKRVSLCITTLSFSFMITSFLKGDEITHGGTEYACVLYNEG